MDLIALPFHDWKKNETEGLRNRDGHLLAHFLASPRVGRVLVIDRPISLPERILKGRPLRCRSGREIARSGRAILSQLTEKLFVADFAARDLLSPLVLKRDWWDAVMREPWVIEKINWAAERAGLSASARTLICWSPLATGPFGKVGESVSLFDADDNWCRHPEMNDRHRWIKRGYEFACKNADVLTCNSENTAEFLHSLGGKPRVIRNGVDADRWDPARWCAAPPPADLARLPRPWIGYAGRLAKRTNVDLIDSLARARPDWSFVLVGPLLDHAWHRTLMDRPNIHFLGDKHYDELPAYVAHFDVSCIFHNVGALENDGDPTKLYEYLALGLPVVTTPIAGVATFADRIDISNEAAEFERLIAAALDRRRADPSAFDSNRQSILGSEHSWKAKADQLLDALDAASQQA